MVNEVLNGERSVATHASIGFIAIFRKTANTAWGTQIRDDSNCLKIFGKFESPLNQMRPPNPTRLSNRAARFGAGNKPLGTYGRGRSDNRAAEKMFFLIRMAFWCSVGLALVPMFAGNGASQSTRVNVEAGDAVSAASATVSDLSGFCDRQPGACNIGAQAAVAFGNQAQAGAKIVYEYLNDRASSKDAATGSVSANNNAARAQKVQMQNGVQKNAAKSTRGASHDTLTAADLAPAWNGPAPRKEVQTKRAG